MSVEDIASQNRPSR